MSMWIPNPGDRFTNMVGDLAPPHADFTQAEADRMPLLAKIPGFSIDVEKLNWHLQNVVKKHEAHYIQRDPLNKPQLRYGGWSVTSFTGEVKDGWQSQSGWKDGKFIPLLAYKNNWRPRWFYTKKTAICTGYLNEVVDQVADMGFNPVAIRIWDNPPGGCHIGKHTDGPNNAYCVRLHIPIVTNPGCVHVWYTNPETRVHMPADGSAYLFRANVNHDTFNYGSTERFHLIFEVWDTKGVIPEFKYEKDISHVRGVAEAWVRAREIEMAREQA